MTFERPTGFFNSTRILPYFKILGQYIFGQFSGKRGRNCSGREGGFGNCDEFVCMGEHDGMLAVRADSEKTLCRDAKYAPL